MKIIKEVLVVILVFSLGFLIADRGEQGMLGGGAYQNSFSGDVTNSATTTTSLLPVKILNVNQSRVYAKITNDSDTVVYLHLGYFADASAASTTVDINEGIRLDANGGSIEFTDNKLYIGQVWATSTAASKKLIYVEK